MKLSKRIFIIMTFLLWGLITVLRIAFHQAWFDEAHAYMLAQNYSLIELISKMNDEGHLFVWYLLIMPFAKLKLWYPYPMQILNWLFVLIALIIMWRKAPFNDVTKFAITFSYPFLAQLPVLARCYSVGVLFLFVLVSMYKNSIKYPVAYAISLIICANTSLMALFGVFPLGLLFAYDMIKATLRNEVSKRNFIISSSICIAGVVLVLWQIGGAVSYSVPTNMHDFSSQFTKYFYFSGKYMLANFYNEIINAGLFLYTIVLLFIKDKRILFFWLFTYFAMLYCFLFRYAGASQHYVFFTIYIMLAYWMLFNKVEKNMKSVVVAEILLCLMFVGQIFSPAVKNDVFFGFKAKTMADKMLTIDNMKNSRVILFLPKAESVVPYMENTGTEFYLYNWALPASNCENFFAFLSLNTDAMYMSPTWLSRSISDDKTNYLLIPIIKGDDTFAFEDRNFKLEFIPVAKLPNNHKLFRIVKHSKS